MNEVIKNTAKTAGKILGSILIVGTLSVVTFGLNNLSKNTSRDVYDEVGKAARRIKDRKSM